MTTWNRAKAYRTINAMIERCAASWVQGTKLDGERFRKLDELLVKAIADRDLESVEYVCERFAVSIERDVLNGRQPSLF